MKLHLFSKVLVFGTLSLAAIIACDEKSSITLPKGIELTAATPPPASSPTPTPAPTPPPGSGRIGWPADAYITNSCRRIGNSTEPARSRYNLPPDGELTSLVDQAVGVAKAQGYVWPNGRIKDADGYFKVIADELDKQGYCALAHKDELGVIKKVKTGDQEDYASYGFDLIDGTTGTPLLGPQGGMLPMPQYHGPERMRADLFDTSCKDANGRNVPASRGYSFAVDISKVGGEAGSYAYQFNESVKDVIRDEAKKLNENKDYRSFIKIPYDLEIILPDPTKPNVTPADPLAMGIDYEILDHIDLGNAITIKLREKFNMCAIFQGHDEIGVKKDNKYDETYDFVHPVGRRSILVYNFAWYHSNASF